MQARIYKPAKTAMQSALGNARDWVLEFAPEEARRIDPLMGWTGSSDTRRQVKLRFETKDQAVDYARRRGIAYVVEEEKPRKLNRRPMGYAGNFAHGRRGNWTH